jgi:acyl-CoA synthetase (AMP-forming)/AMP-acid ligase II
MNQTTTLLQAFEGTVSCHADTLFIDGECQLTYGDTAIQLIQRARQLRAASTGFPVILSGPNTAEWVLCFLAARAAGLVVVPLSEETTDDQWQALSRLLGPNYRLDIARGSGELVNPEAVPRNLPARAGICLPTSGSTGQPRCALRSDTSLLEEGQRYLHGFGLTPDDRILTALPLCHAFALGATLGAAVATGCTLVLTSRFRPRPVQRLLREGRASILPLVPATARLLCEAFHDGGPPPLGLRHLIIGAGPVTPRLERDVVERFGLVPARNYGSSETGATLGTTGQTPPREITGIGLPGVETAISGESGPGALFVRAAEPFIGYLSPDGIDASRISPDGWYSTGDYAIRDAAGWITVTGRIGTSLRRGGRFIQPAEVEQALRRHPDVTDATVMGRPDADGEDIVEAHVETRTGVPIPVEALRQHLAALLEGYKIPMAWQFYAELPRTSGGKPARTQLTDPTPEA